MALVQWKQISPQLGDYGQLTGSLEITGSFILNGQELDLSGGVVSSNQTLSLNGYELSISNGNTVTLPQGGGSADTGSLITSASAVGNEITFLYGDGTTQTVTINTGSSSQPTDISALNTFTSSYFVDSASFDSRISNITSSTADTSGLLTTASYQIDSASFDSRISNITSSTADTTGLLTTASYVIDSASFDSRISAINVSGDTSFDGNRVITNELLGDLYSTSYNAGTTGSIQDFLSAIFFPAKAPTAVFIDQTSNFNTNLATANTNLVSVSLTDTADDSPYSLTLSGTNASSLTAVPTNAESSSWEIRANGNLTAGTYSYDVTVGDSTNAERTYSGRSIVIAQASTGTLTGDTSIYIIESALSGSPFRDATGYNNGNPADLNITYSPNYGNQVASFTSSNPAIGVNSSGNLSLGINLSGSSIQSGDTFNTTVTWNDQYGNQDSALVTATVFGNQAPSVLFTDNELIEATATSGSNIGTLTVTDTESNSPYQVILSGTDGTKFNIIPQNAVSSSWLVQPKENLLAGNYSIQFTVTDTYSEQVVLNETIAVSSGNEIDTFFIYTLPITGTYNNVSGITAESQDTPPIPTVSTAYGFFNEFINSNTLGNSTINVSYGENFVATLRGAVTGSNLDSALNDLGPITIGGSPASERIYILVPSGSNVLGIPTSTTLADPGIGTADGEYVLFVSPDGTYQDSSGGVSNDIKQANIHKVTLNTAVNGYLDWFVIGTEDKFNNPNAYVRIVPSSGSIPS